VCRTALFILLEKRVIIICRVLFIDAAKAIYGVDNAPVTTDISKLLQS
jgi:hypothetical protein